MELLISEIVARKLYRDANDAVQKAFTVLNQVIFYEKRNRVLIPKWPQMTRTELGPPNKTKSATNDMHRKRSDFLKL